MLGSRMLPSIVSLPLVLTVTKSGPRAKPPPPSLPCVVPNVTGKKLAKAKAAITDAHCKVGKITKKKSSVKPGRVRMKLLKKFYDRTGNVTGAFGYYVPKDVVDVGDRFVKELVDDGIAKIYDPDESDEA